MLDYGFIHHVKAFNYIVSDSMDVSLSQMLHVIHQSLQSLTGCENGPSCFIDQEIREILTNHLV